MKTIGTLLIETNISLSCKDFLESLGLTRKDSGIKNYSNCDTLKYYENEIGEKFRFSTWFMNIENKRILQLEEVEVNDG